MAEASKVDSFDAALGEVVPQISGREVRGDFQAGATFSWGDVLLTPEGADAVNQLRRACAVRDLSIPKAVMLLLRHYLQQQAHDGMGQS